MDHGNITESYGKSGYFYRDSFKLQFVLLYITRDQNFFKE